MSSAVLLSGFAADTTEERLGEICRQIGPVLRLQLAFDQTGAPIGKAVAQFVDVETARSAVRNLGGTQLAGRTVRCKFIEDDGIRALFPQDYMDSKQDGDDWASLLDSRAALRQKIPPLPAGVSVEDPSVSRLNQIIYETLLGVPREQLERVVDEVAQLCAEKPDMAHVVLERCPQLLAATVQACLLLDKATPDSVKQILISK